MERSRESGRAKQCMKSHYGFNIEIHLTLDFPTKKSIPTEQNKDDVTKKDKNLCFHEQTYPSISVQIVDALETKKRTVRPSSI
jgi:hypothetical protein